MMATMMPTSLPTMPPTGPPGSQTTTVYATLVTNFTAVQASSVYASILNTTGIANASGVLVNVSIDYQVVIQMTFPTVPTLQVARAAFAKLLNVTPDKVNVTISAPSRRLAASAGRRLDGQVTAVVTSSDLSEATQVSSLNATAFANDFSGAYASAAASLGLNVTPISNPTVGAVSKQVVSSVVVFQPLSAVPVVMPSASTLTAQLQAASTGMANAVLSTVTTLSLLITTTSSPTGQPTSPGQTSVPTLLPTFAPSTGPTVSPSGSPNASRNGSGNASMNGSRAPTTNSTHDIESGVVVRATAFAFFVVAATTAITWPQM